MSSTQKRALTYRLTESEYYAHLEASGDILPRTTMQRVREAAPAWIVESSHATASYDAGEGVYYLTTISLRVAL